MKRVAVMVSAVCVLACGAMGQDGSQPKEPPKQEPAKQEPAKAVQPPSQPAKLVYVRMSTTAGDILLELNQDKAPLSVDNFLAYVEKKEYDGTIFHRVIPTFMVQGGGYSPDLTERKGGQPIKNEWRNGLKNVRGSIAMAREAEPDSATREFYINVVDNPKLDGPRETTGNAGYAVFGRVAAGMDVVDKIRHGATASRPDKEMENVPLDPVRITKVVKVGVEEAAKEMAKAGEGTIPAAAAGGGDGAPAKEPSPVKK
jgi:peptidyl-prolyl cis-trans isomerase A (cyclophilin A)